MDDDVIIMGTGSTGFMLQRPQVGGKGSRCWRRQGFVSINENNRRESENRPSRDVNLF